MDDLTTFTYVKALNMSTITAKHKPLTTYTTMCQQSIYQLFNNYTAWCKESSNAFVTCYKLTNKCTVLGSKCLSEYTRGECKACVGAVLQSK